MVNNIRASNVQKIKEKSMIADVYQQINSLFHMTGKCEISDLSNGIVEVLDVVPEEVWSPLRSYGWLDSHQFDVLRMAGASGERMALIAHSDACPAVLPGWIATAASAPH
ncbi:hypothetical protein GXW73_27575 [Roseomonas hellenica]|nr:hypothetical protein [Plastoroseomonas hellenica]